MNQTTASNDAKTQAADRTEANRSLMKKNTRDHLCGMTFGDWLTVLSENGFAIDRSQLRQALRITATSLFNSPLRVLENVIFRSRAEAAKLDAPVFVIGHFRSGTTFLHRVLTQDDAYATPNVWQVSNPHTFLLTERIGPKIFKAAAKRGQDNVEWGWNVPRQDDFGIGLVSRSSIPIIQAFPRNHAYERFLTMRDASPEELERWKAAVMYFMRKIAYRYGNKPLLLKNTVYAARIRYILQMFPKARFIHIRRNPYAVFQSSYKWWQTQNPNWFLQVPDWDITERILRWYTLIYDAYFEDVPSIPKGQFHELIYEDFERDPIPHLRETYQKLGMGDFAVAEPKFRGYLDKLKSYQKNSYAQLPDDVRGKIAERWKKYFTAWGYSI